MGWFEDNGAPSSRPTYLDEQGNPRQNYGGANALATASSWFDPNSGGGAPPARNGGAPPAAPGSNLPGVGRQGYTGADLQARLTALYQKYFGRDPSARELAAYGNDIDDRYLQSIEQNLQNSAEGKQYRHTSVQKQLGNIYQELLGRAPTQAELDAWGADITDADIGRIRQQIAGSQEAIQYEQNPHKAPTTTPAEDWTSKDYSDWNTVKAYAASRGVTMSDQTAQYWAGKYNSPEFNGDRAYFFQRLSTDPVFGGGGGGGGLTGLLAPFTENFSYDDFKAPTMEELKSSPGFQASLDRASDILQRSAAAKGSLLSGSTAQALSDNTADLTTQGYGNLFNQKAQTYSTNRGNAFDAYKERRANFYQNQDSPFAKLMGLASLQQQDIQGQRQINLGYAGLGSNTINNGAAQYNGLLTGSGNAQAGGIMGQNNAYQSLYGNLAQMPYLWAMMQQNRGGGGSGFNRGTPGNPNLTWPPY